MRLPVKAVLVIYLAIAALHTYASPHYSGIMPLSQVRAGMLGYGLTVFRGTTVERFQVTVLGVVPHGSLLVPGHDMILVRLKGGPMTNRGAYLIQGMSGSPVYVNGRLIGAFSQGEENAREPMGGVTPIEDMLHAWDPRVRGEVTAALLATHATAVELRTPIFARNRVLRKVVLNVPRSLDWKSHGSTLVLRPCTMLAAANGFSPRARMILASALEKFNVELAPAAAAGGAMPGLRAPALKPGSSFGILLVSGDQYVGATGTVTYRVGNRILGFGHRMLGLGYVDAPITTTYVHAVYPIATASYKVVSQGPVVGVCDYDGRFGVSGIMGGSAHTIPVTVTISDSGTGVTKTYHMQTVSHPALFDALIAAGVESAISDVHPIEGPMSAAVSLDVSVPGLTPLHRSNLVFDPRAVDGAAGADLEDVLGLLASNPYRPTHPSAVNVTVRLVPGQPTASITHVTVPLAAYAPGDTVDLRTAIKPFGAPEQVLHVAMPLPLTMPAGSYSVEVSGGAPAASVQIGALVLRPGAPPSDGPPASNLQQLEDQITSRPDGTDILARVLLPTSSPVLDGAALANLPPALDGLLRLPRTSGVPLARDQIRSLIHTQWVVSGRQNATLTVRSTPGDVASSAEPQTGATGVVDWGTGSVRNIYEVSKPIGRSMQISLGQPVGAESSNALVAGARSQTTRPDGPYSATTLTTSNSLPSQRLYKQLQFWRMISPLDWAHGTMEGAGVRDEGGIEPVARLRVLASVPDQYLVCGAPDNQGGFYVGAAPGGRVIHIDSRGVRHRIVDIPEPIITSIALVGADTLLVGTGPRGRIYSVGPGSKTALLCTLPQPYVLALCDAGSGTLYASTGGATGGLYTVTVGGSFKLVRMFPCQHVMALLPTHSGNLYVGCARPGSIWRRDTSGSWIAISDTGTDGITALAETSGRILAATGPHGRLIEVGGESSSAHIIMEHPQAGFRSIVADGAGGVYAAAADGIYNYSRMRTLVKVPHSDTLWTGQLVESRAGVVALASAPGQALALDPPGVQSPGEYLTDVHDAGEVSRLGRIMWTGSVPHGAKLAINMRTGAVERPDDSWTKWRALSTTVLESNIPGSSARFMQVQAVLTPAEDGRQPTLETLEISYLPGASAPDFKINAPAGGERWSGSQTLRWTQPDSRGKVEYTVMYSADDGATWLPIPSGMDPVSGTVVAAAQAASPGIPGQPSEVEKQLDQHPELPAAVRAAILQHSEKQPPAAAVSPGAQSQPATLFVLNTALLKDGMYRFMVVCSDTSNGPPGQRISSAQSRPVLICNAAPRLSLVPGSPVVLADRSVEATGIANQTLVAVTDVEFQVDGSPWQSAVPSDGIFDSGSIKFTLHTDRLSIGAHTLNISAGSGSGTHTTVAVPIIVH